MELPGIMLRSHILSLMALSARDAQLVQIRDGELLRIMDAALDEAARRSGAWLACKQGCTQCCHGAFAINALDAARLRSGIRSLQAADPATAEAVQKRTRTWIEEYGPAFPGDRISGVLGVSDEDQARFDDFANEAPCPALNPTTGLCDVYAWRPMTCRVFGPPTRPSNDDPLGCCELCFVGVSDAEIAACEMPVPQALETELVAATGDANETVVAFALLRDGEDT
jgi:Fe-S-cluster containining protein